MLQGESLAIVQSLISSAVFSGVLAGALAYAWRLYRQTYLVHWACYWGIYLVIWTLDGTAVALGLQVGEEAWVVLRSVMTLGSFSARAVLAVGVMNFLGRRLPRPGEWALIALTVVVFSAASIGTFAAGAPPWLTLPFRTYFLGFFISAPLAWAVLRSHPAPSQRLLGLALAVAALSDAWDVTVEVAGASPWTATGEALYLSYFVVHLTDALFASGMLVAAIGTERHRAEHAAEEVRRRDAALQEAQRQETIGQLAGGLAHDFNNLLTAVIGHLALVREALVPGSEAAKDAEIANDAAERAARLTRQLLTYARRQPAAHRIIDPSTVVGSLDRLAVPLLGPRINRSLALAPAPWPVRADPTQLEQLLLNLIVNARDAMPDGGTLRVETANEVLGSGPRAEDASGVPAGEWVRITVEDTGHGMDATTRARMFEPFYTTKPPGKGSGLGLAAAQGIVQQAGGHIGLRTAPGRGTRLSVFLPRADGEPSPVRAPSATPARGGDETILLVEDDPAVRTLATRSLELRGYAVLTAGDGEEALRLVATRLGEVDLLLTDVAMPGMDGRDLSRRLLALRPDLPVLFMSGHASGNPEDLGGTLLGKPFTPEVLAARVRDVLDAGRLAGGQAPKPP